MSIDRDPGSGPAWQRLVERGSYPLVLGGSLVASWALQGAGVPVGLAVGPVVFAAVLAVWALEALHPHAAAWKPPWRTFWLDVTHSVLSANGTALILKATLLSAAATAGARLAEATGGAAWPSGWPIGLQLALALLIGDFGAYWAHRSMHLTRTGWRIHAVHHSPTRLHVMAAGRTHPFNAAYTFACEGIVVALLGAGPAVIGLWTVAKAVNGLLQHSNIALRPGVLSYVLATSDNHRWHHSRILDESNTNFGNTTMIWDLVFRTFFLPRDRQPGLDVGIDGAAVPESYLAHLATPFVLQRWEETR